MDLPLIIVVLTGIVAAVIVGVLVIGLVRMSIRVRRARVRPSSQPTPPRPLAGVRAVVEGSIGMYLLRRLTGRPTNGPADPPASEPPLLTAEQIAYRIRLDGAVRPDRKAQEVPKVGVAAAAPAHASRPARPPGRSSAPTTEPTAPRERLVRDTGFALAGLLAIGLVAFVVWPSGNTEQQPASTDLDVAGASATPEPGTPTMPVATAVVGAAESPAGSVAAETSAPSPIGPPAATPGPADPQAPGPTARPTPRGSTSPTTTPRPTATPRTTPSPSPTSAATPTPTGTPTPTATPSPTPDPTATPDPPATPTPTPEPTTETTPEPPP